MKKSRFIIAVISSLLDEALILGLLLWGLPKLGVEIPLPVVIIAVVLFAAFAVWSFTLGTRILNMKPLTGLTDFIGLEGIVVQKLNPGGLVKIGGELWEAISLEGTYEKGTEIIVVTQKGLKLGVKKK